MSDADKIKAALSELKFDALKANASVFFRGKWVPAEEAAANLYITQNWPRPRSVPIELYGDWCSPEVSRRTRDGVVADVLKLRRPR